MMTLPFVQDVLATTGCCFDERFFCHCEDTDLVLRANLLGYRPACVDELVPLYEGQANSLGQHSTSNAYQCLRNTIWMPCKSMPK